MKYNPNLEVKASIGTNVPDMRPLHFACAGGKTALAKAMMEAGADVNAVDGHGQTPLLRAMQNRHEEIIDSLLEHGADATIASSRGATPLIYLADPVPAGEDVVQDWEKDARIASKMIQANVDVNAKDDGGLSALHWAAKNGHVEFATVLLKEGNADVNLLNDERQSALLLATVFLLSRETPTSTKKRIDALLDLLVVHGADENVGVSPFDIAMRAGRPDLMKRMDRHVLEGEDSAL